MNIEQQYVYHASIDLIALTQKRLITRIVLYQNRPLYWKAFKIIINSEVLLSLKAKQLMIAFTYDFGYCNRTTNIA